jgi:hypothetical protein
LGKSLAWLTAKAGGGGIPDVISLFEGMVKETVVASELQGDTIMVILESSNVVSLSSVAISGYASFHLCVGASCLLAVRPSIAR